MSEISKEEINYWVQKNEREKEMHEKTKDYWLKDFITKQEKQELEKEKMILEKDYLIALQKKALKEMENMVKKFQ